MMDYLDRTDNKEDYYSGKWDKNFKGWRNNN